MPHKLRMTRFKDDATPRRGTGTPCALGMFYGADRPASVGSEVELRNSKRGKNTRSRGSIVSCDGELIRSISMRQAARAISSICWTALVMRGALTLNRGISTSPTRDTSVGQAILSSLQACSAPITTWKKDYNRHRPNSVLGNIQPTEFAMKIGLEVMAAWARKAIQGLSPIPEVQGLRSPSFGCGACQTNAPAMSDLVCRLWPEPRADAARLKFRHSGPAKGTTDD